MKNSKLLMVLLLLLSSSTFLKANYDNKLLTGCNEDTIPPIVICDRSARIALGTVDLNPGTNGLIDESGARMHWDEIDDGSTDNCGIATRTLKRLSTNGCNDGTDGDNSNNLQAGEFVDFCCSDIGNTIQVLYTVTDSAGNSNTCIVNVTVEDKLRPVVICDAEPVFPVKKGESLRLRAKDLDDGSIDNCAVSDLYYSFSTDLSDTVRVLEEGSHTLSLYVTDIAGNWTSCSSDVVVFSSDSSNVVRISGHVDGPLTTTVRAYNSSYSQTVALDAQGNYSLLVPKGDDITIEPIPKNDDYLNGVSTLDVMLIARHISGVQHLNNPLNLLAADVNLDHQITAADTADIRNVILGGSDAFSGAKSWVFFPSTEQFNWGELPDEFNESIRLTNVQTHIVNLDFRAVKMGNIDHNENQQNCENDKTPPVVICDLERTFDSNPWGLELNAEEFSDGTYDNCTATDDLIYSFSSNPNDSLYVLYDPGVYYIDIWVTDENLNQNSCRVKVTVNCHQGTREELLCNDNIKIRSILGCGYSIGADDLLEGQGYNCYQSYFIELASDEDFSNILASSYGELFLSTLEFDAGVYYYRITDTATNNSCWSSIELQLDNVDLSLECKSQVFKCDKSLSIQDVLNTSLRCTNRYSAIIWESSDMNTVIDTIYRDEEIGLRNYNMVYVQVIDNINNEDCFSTVNFGISKELEEIISIPEDVTVDCAEYIMNPSETISPDNTGLPTVDSGYQFVEFSYDDKVECGEIIRSWKAIDGCTGNTLTNTQVISLEGDCGSQNLVCNGNVRVYEFAECPVSIEADDLLEGANYCYEHLFIEIAEEESFTNILASGYEFVEANIDFGSYYVRVTDSATGESCWTSITIEEVVLNLVNETYVIEKGCETDLSIADLFRISQYCKDDYLALIWEDSSSTVFIDSLEVNESVQLSSYGVVYIDLLDKETGETYKFIVYLGGPDSIDFNEVFAPVSDITVSCTDYQADPNSAIDPDQTGRPFTFNSQNFYTDYQDRVITDSEGCGAIVREWTVVSWCTSEETTHTQLINIESSSNKVCARTISGEGIVDVVMDSNLITSKLGCVGFDYGDVTIFEPYKDDSSLEGIDAFDVIAILDLILGLDSLSAHQQFVADLNHDGQVNIDDLAIMRQWLRNEAIPQGQMWYFFDDQEYNIHTNLFVDTPAQLIVVDSSLRTDYGFVGIKKGDLNGSYGSSQLQSEGEYLVMFKDEMINQGQQYRFKVKAGAYTELQTLDLGISFDNSRIELIDIESEYLSEFQISESSSGDIRVNFLATLEELLKGGVEVQEGDVLFELVIEAKVNSILSEEFTLNQNHQNIVKQSDLKLPNNVVTEWEDKLTVDAIQHWVSDVVIYPNPTSDVIYIDAKDEGLVNYKLMDLSGRLVLEGKTRANEAINVASLRSGLYIMHVLDAENTQTIKVHIQ